MGVMLTIWRVRMGCSPAGRKEDMISVIFAGDADRGWHLFKGTRLLCVVSG